MFQNKPNNSETYRFFEVGGIIAFLFLVIAMLLFNTNVDRGATEQAAPNTKIEAYAIAMPNQGWAPMTVYFSAFGSASQAGDIIQYEWDLDANGLYDTDATAEGGYASYHYGYLFISPQKGIVQKFLSSTSDLK